MAAMKAPALQPAIQSTENITDINPALYTTCKDSFHIRQNNVSHFAFLVFQIDAFQ